MGIVLNVLECEDIVGVKGYIDYVEEKCRAITLKQKASYQNLLQDFREKQEHLIVQEKSKFSSKLEQYSMEIYESNLEQVKSFVKDVENNLVSVIDKVLDKVGVYNISAEQVGNMVSFELAKLIDNKAITIRGNADTIKYLGFCIDIPEVNSTYIEDANMLDGFCKISDGVSVIVVDVANASAKIKELFAKPETMID